MLKNQAGPCDLVFMLNAHADIKSAERLSGLYGCHKPVPAFHSASLKMGRRLVLLGFRLTGDGRLGDLKDKNIHHPVAFGAVSAAMGITKKDAAYGFLYNWTASAASAAIRLIPLGHDAAQDIIYEMHDAIRLAYIENKDTKAGDAWQFTPEAEIAGIEHEKLYTRLFLS
jgi:urease accessory protein